MKTRLRRLSIGLYVLAAGSVALYAPSTLASSLSEDQQKLNQLQSQRSSIQQQVESDSAKAVTLKHAVETYDNAIHTVDVQISSSNAHISTLQAQESTLTAELVKNQTDLVKQQNSLAQMVRAEYEDGNVSYLDVLFQATNFGDFLSRLYDLTLVSNTQNQVVQNVESLKKSIVQKQNQVQTSENQLKSVRDQLQTLQQTDESIKAQRQQDLVNVQNAIESGQSKQGLLESQIQLTQSDIQTIEAETQAAEANASNPAYVQQQQANLISANVPAMIHFAESFMGTPYVWGGTSPSGFDCSGFTQYVLQHFGVSINRTSEDQFASGVPVNEGSLQPGDLVFFSTYAAGATHVGIYIGNGMMVDSEDMGVTIDSISNSYWGPKYLGARRYTK